MKAALTIAGSDSSGGAGIQADLKTFQAFGIFGTTAITAVTCQNTQKVSDIQGIDPGIVKSQILAVLEDIPLTAAKTGMLYSAEIMRAFLDIWSDKNTGASEIPLVVDPVMVSTSGDRLVSEEAEMLYFEIFKHAKIITPNLPEASVLVSKKIESISEMKEAAVILFEKTHSNILIKGGHGISGKNQNESLDIFYDGNNFTEFSAERIKSTNTHGTGCTLSAAIAAGLALGMEVKEAVKTAKEYVTGAIQHAPGLGSGHGPLNHMWRQKTR